MARFSRIEVALKMKETGMVPVFYHGSPEICKKVVKACYDGGVRVFEFTNRGDFAHDTFAQLSRYVNESLPDLMLGAGSVVDGPTAALYIQLGADFIVSPVVKDDMAVICNRRKILWSPGCGSLSEISRAEELGAEVVKIFPAQQVGGPDFVKSIKGPSPWSSIMPTGGVEPKEENLRAWFEAGVHCVGMGSQLISKNYIESEAYDQLTRQVKDTLEIIRRIKA